MKTMTNPDRTETESFVKGEKKKGGNIKASIRKKGEKIRGGERVDSSLSRDECFAVFSEATH